MINVICVKWGDKYSHEDVNRLHTMVKRYLNTPFTFYCYTDNPTNIDANIIKIKSNYLETYWNKLAMFQNNFVPDGPCLYFDLDLVIQNPIDTLLDYLSDNLTMIKCHWKGNIITDGSSHREKDRWDMNVNSSVLLWKSNSLTQIWKHFYKNADYFMVQYKGIDRFLFHEKFKLNYFPEGLFYSRMNGEKEEDYTHAKLYDVNLFKNIQTRVRMKDFKEIYLHHIPHKMICLFNGPTEDWTYEGFESYWS